MPIAQSSSKHQTENKFQKRTQRVTECESEHKPEVVTTTGTKTPPEQPEFIKQTLIIIEKKVRNLDKRRVIFLNNFKISYINDFKKIRTFFSKN